MGMKSVGSLGSGAAGSAALGVAPAGLAWAAFAWVGFASAGDRATGAPCAVRVPRASRLSSFTSLHRAPQRPDQLTAVVDPVARVRPAAVFAGRPRLLAAVGEVWTSERGKGGKAARPGGHECRRPHLIHCPTGRSSDLLHRTTSACIPFNSNAHGSNCIRYRLGNS
jgi:hypothetical protein